MIAGVVGIVFLIILFIAGIGGIMYKNNSKDSRYHKNNKVSCKKKKSCRDCGLPKKGIDTDANKRAPDANEAEDASFDDEDGTSTEQVENDMETDADDGEEDDLFAGAINYFSSPSNHSLPISV